MSLALAPRRIKCSAQVLFNPENDEGGYDGWRRIYQVTAMSVSYSTEEDSVISVDPETYGQTVDSSLQAGTTTIKMSANRVNGYGLSLSHRGEESEITAGSTNVTGEVVGFEGDDLHLPNRAISSVVIRGINITVDDTTDFVEGNVLTNDTTGKTIGVIVEVVDGTHLTVFLTGTEPVATDVVSDGASHTATVASVAASNSLAVVTTDFTISSAEYGKVTRVAGGALDLPNLDRVTMNYTFTQFEGSEIAMAAKTQRKGQLKILGDNVSDDKRIDVFLRQATITPDGDIPIVTAETGEYGFTGTAATPSGNTNLGWIRLAV